MTKVVYCTTFGGLNLSDAALERMLELGSEYVKENPKYNEKNEYGDTVKWWEKKYCLDYTIPRHDENLVRVVLELGDSASEECKLEIVDVLNQYIIHEYDGKETVIQPQTVDWIYVNNNL